MPSKVFLSNTIDNAVTAVHALETLSFSKVIIPSLSSVVYSV